MLTIMVSVMCVYQVGAAVGAVAGFAGAAIGFSVGW